MLLCQYCAQEAKNSNSHRNHERCCPGNPNRKYSNGMLGKKGGNQWTKAKAEGRSVVISEETKKRFSAASSARRHSAETKERLSSIRKKYLEENPDKVPYLLNHSCKVSYPEQYFSDCFDKLIGVIFQHQVFRYSLDFANVEKKLYFEVDGEQHYVDKRIVEHDKRRTEKLSELGWVGNRIRWAHFQKLTAAEKEQKVCEIKKFMQWIS